MANELQKNRDLRRSIGRDLVDIEPSAIVELYELYFDIDFLPFRFHSGTNGITKDVIWRGNSYVATAIEVEGFEANTMGRLPRPKVTVANQDFAISNILREFSDFRNGKFIRYRLFLKNLDNENFDDNQNPFGNPDSNAYLSEEKYHVSQKIVENKHLVQFELITPFDLESIQTPSRAIYGRYCYWQYRGIGCNYQGDLICKDNDEDFSVLPKKHIKDVGGKFVGGGGFDKILSLYKWKEDQEYRLGDIVYIENRDLNGFKDPIRTWYVCVGGDDQKTVNFISGIIFHISNRGNRPSQKSKFWEKDGCAKTISACQKRFDAEFYEITKGEETYTAYNDSDAVNKVLPFGGFRLELIDSDMNNEIFFNSIEDLLQHLKNISEFNLLTEICGFVGKKNDKLVYKQMENRSKNPGVYFIIDAFDHLSFIKDNETLLIFHSHLCGDEEPSEFDIKTSENCCFPFLIYSVVTEKFSIYEPQYKDYDVNIIQRLKELI